NGSDTHCGFTGKIFSTPPKERPGSSNLAANQGLGLHLTARRLYDMSQIKEDWSDHRIARLADAILGYRGSHEIRHVDKAIRAPPLLHRRLGRIMGSDEAALIQLWREKRGEANPEDLAGNLIVQLGSPTEELNRCWYERNTGRRVRDVQRRVRHSAIAWMVATLDGIVEDTEAVFESKFMLPWSFSEEAAAEKYMAQLQHNMWVTHLRTSVLSILTGGGKWVESTIPMDPLYLSVLVSAEKKFWRCVQSGEPPHLINAAPPRPRIEAIRIVDMSGSNSWAEFAALFRNTRTAFLDHERAKSELKALMPEDAKEAIGHGVKAKRSKSGAVSFDLLETEATHA